MARTSYDDMKMMSFELEQQTLVFHH